MVFAGSCVQANISTLLPVFESFLDLAPDSSAQDTIRQSVIILMGSLARHLDKADPKVSWKITSHSPDARLWAPLPLRPCPHFVPEHSARVRLSLGNNVNTPFFQGPTPKIRAGCLCRSTRSRPCTQALKWVFISWVPSV